jgi:anti-anti-sigma factor
MIGAPWSLNKVLNIRRKSARAPQFLAHWRFPESPKRHASLALTGRVGYEDATALRAILFEMIRGDAPHHIVVELGALERIDTAGVAVLVEGLIAARATGQEMLLCEPSSTVRATFELAGLQEALRSCCQCPKDVQTRIEDGA